ASSAMISCALMRKTITLRAPRNEGKNRRRRRRRPSFLRMAVQIMVEILREIGWEIIGHPDELRKLWIQGRSRSRLHLDRIHPDSRPIRQINSIRQHDFSFRD